MHNEELHELNSPPGLKKMIQAMNEEGVAQGMNRREEKCMQHSGGISLRKISIQMGGKYLNASYKNKKYAGRVWTGFIWPGTVTSGRLL